MSPVSEKMPELLATAFKVDQLVVSKLQNPCKILAHLCSTCPVDDLKQLCSAGLRGFCRTLGARTQSVGLWT